jgi:hypothetical protein
MTGIPDSSAQKQNFWIQEKQLPISGYAKNGQLPLAAEPITDTVFMT